MQKEILEALYKPFDLKARVGVGNKTFKYIPSDDVVDRMNRVFKGNWSTEVIEKEIMEDQILMRVRVTVVDYSQAERPMAYCQEGYASQPIARFTSGPKANQIIDLGNSFKSAMSKAIKTAVARWGLGLYLEDDSSSTEFADDVPNFVNESTDLKPVNSPKVDSGSGDFPFFGETENTSTNPQPAKTSEPKKAAPVENMPPFMEDDLVVSGPPAGVDFNPPLDSLPTSDKADYLTTVQKAAIENVMEVHGKTFQELVKSSLERTSDLPESIDKVTYSDAVKMIQHGNNLNANV